MRFSTPALLVFSAFTKGCSAFSTFSHNVRAVDKAFLSANRGFENRRFASVEAVEEVTSNSANGEALLNGEATDGEVKVVEATNGESKAVAPKGPQNVSTKKGEKITEKQVRSLFSLWDASLATGDSRMVAARYHSEGAVLLPTVSDVPRTDFDSIKDYFDAFLLKQPSGEILEGNISIGDSWASDVGIYEFTMGATGDKVKGRYSYFYEPDADGNWKIKHHHSSVMPEEVIMGKAISDQEVRDLFGLWNDALATLDPKQVALRYAKEAVLLPTVSDTPRTDFRKTEDYFINFLKLEPQGKILESHVSKGNNWCQDVGK